MAFLCPNVNSYRRFGAQFYVPNSPSWGSITGRWRLSTDRVPGCGAYSRRRGGRGRQPVSVDGGCCAGVHHGYTKRSSWEPVVRTPTRQ
ncbi:hypothetical protein ACVBEG_26955 [Pseudomonas sp. GG8]